RPKFIIRKQNLGNQIQSVGHWFRQVNVVEILARDSGYGSAATSQAAVRVVKSVMRRKLAIGARAFFHGPVKDDNAQRAFRRAASRGPRDETRAAVLAGAIGFLVKRHAEP